MALDRTQKKIRYKGKRERKDTKKEIASHIISHRVLIMYSNPLQFHRQLFSNSTIPKQCDACREPNTHGTDPQQRVCSSSDSKISVIRCMISFVFQPVTAMLLHYLVLKRIKRLADIRSSSKYIRLRCGRFASSKQIHIIIVAVISATAAVSIGCQPHEQLRRSHVFVVEHNGSLCKPQQLTFVASVRRHDGPLSIHAKSNGDLTVIILLQVIHDHVVDERIRRIVVSRAACNRRVLPLISGDLDAVCRCTVIRLSAGSHIRC